MKKSIQVQLAEALDEVEQLRIRLSSLARAAERDAAVPPEQTSQLKTEYEERLQAVEQKVSSLKSGFARQIRQMEITLRAYDEQIAQLKAKAASGQVTPRRYKREIEKLSRGRHASEEKLSALQTMSRAESGADLSNMIPPPEVKIGRGTLSVNDLILRYAGMVPAVMLLVSIFMPVATAMGTGHVSLLQAGRLAQMAGDGRGVFLWLIPLAVACAAGAASMARNRMVRGGLMLALGTLCLAPLAMAMAFALFYPRTGADGLDSLAEAVINPGSGAFVILAALTAIYIFGGVNVGRSSQGRRWCILATMFLILVSLGTTAYCVVIVNAKPTVTVAIGDQGLFGANLDIDVFNGGNLPLVLRRELGQTSKRNEFVLKIQRRGQDQGWQDVETGLGLGVLDVDNAIVKPNTTRTITWPAKIETDSAVVFRAVLVNANGRVVISKPVEVVRSRSAAAVHSRSASVSDTTDENANLTLAQKKVDELEAQGGTITERMLSHEVAAARDAVDKLQDSTEKEYMHRRIDRVILTVRDRQAKPLMDKAADYANKKLDSMALAAYKDATDIYQRVPKPLVLHDVPQIVREAEQAIRRIQLSRNPIERFEVRGIVKRGGTAVAMLFDKLTGSSRPAQEGERLDEFQVEKVDQSQGIVTISRGGKRFELYGR